MTQETRYTVFARWNDNSSRHGKECYFPSFDNEPQEMAERIEYVRNYLGSDSFEPIAWTAVTSVSFQGFDGELAASLAAGRLIEKIDGQWVARGVEEEKPKPAQTLGDLLRQALDRGIGKPVSATPTLDNAAMIARDGPAKSKCGCQKCGGTRGGVPGNENCLNGMVMCDYCTADALAAAPVSTAKPNPFPSFRNPDSCDGPADHLNAARHQMAGMKG